MKKQKNEAHSGRRKSAVLGLKSNKGDIETMDIQIPETGVIKKQKVEINSDVSIIYGYNNSGKTTLLKALDKIFANRQMEQFILGQSGDPAVYIPTNRIIVSEYSTEQPQLKDREEWLHYQKDSYKDYSLHLKRLRDHLLCDAVVHQFICQAIHKIFDIDIRELNSRYSDGIENIINIYLSIIWAMMWDVDFSEMTGEAFYDMIAQKQLYVMIDEIEMYLHVNIQSKLIGSMKQDFSACHFILTTHSPLLLTRYRQCLIYKIQAGRLKKIEEDMYYEDLNIIYEQLFDVEELPKKVRKDLNLLGKVVMENKAYDTEKIRSVIQQMRKEYPNLSRRYNAIITKAQYIGEKNDQNNQNLQSKGISKDE